jgi:hypothetical protein
MFICKECLEKYYDNDFFAPVPSYGPCEICKKNADCEDVPHRYLQKKSTSNMLTEMSEAVRYRI